MKKSTALLNVILLCLCSISINAGNNKDPIDWENECDPVRSIIPISGYVNNDIITIHLYESPSEATVRIIDERGTIVYENVYDNPQPLVIDVEASATGSYEITVEYDGKAFVGHFVL